MHAITRCMPSHDACHHTMHPIARCMPSHNACHHMMHAIARCIPSHDASHRTIHPIAPCIPSHHASHCKKHPIAQSIPLHKASRRRMDGAQTVSAPRLGPRGSAPCPRAALLRLPAPSKRLRRDVFALGPWRMLSIELLFRVFGRLVTVLEGNNLGTCTPFQQDTN